MARKISINVSAKLGHKLNSMTKYMECSREDLMEFLIVEGWKSIDAQKKKIDVSELGLDAVSFVTEGEL